MDVGKLKKHAKPEFFRHFWGKLTISSPWVGIGRTNILSEGVDLPFKNLVGGFNPSEKYQNGNLLQIGLNLQKIFELPPLETVDLVFHPYFFCNVDLDFQWWHFDPCFDWMERARPCLLDHWSLSGHTEPLPREFNSELYPWRMMGFGRWDVSFLGAINRPFFRGRNC